MSPEKEHKLRQAMERARNGFTSLPGPSDDPDEQTAVAAAYRHVLVTIQMLASPILPQPVRAKLDELEVDITTMYDVYEVIPKLNVLMLDIDEALGNLRHAHALTGGEIDRLVRNWIGVDGGYLGYPEPLRFSYATHDDFWMSTCGIVVDTYGFHGTTRECFIDTLAHASPEQQAGVVEAILDRFPVIDPPDPGWTNLRRPKVKRVIEGWIERLRSDTAPAPTTLASASDEVRAALADADTLGPARAVDRVHTAMHGYLHQLCATARITVDAPDPTMAKLLKVLRQQHPALGDATPGGRRASQVLQAMGQILDVLNPIRNEHSPAHPLNDLLGVPEAALVCDTVRAMLTYLERRVHDAGT